VKKELRGIVRRFAKFLLRLLKITEVNDISDTDLEYLCWIVSLYIKVQSVPGHIAEVGVADGRNAVIFGKLIKQYNDSSVRQYLGFDTFEGYSDRDLKRDKQLSAKAWKDVSEDAVLRRCKDNDVEDLVELISGDAVQTIPLTLTSHKGLKFQPAKAKFALLYIDCNAFEPALKSMKYFMPYMMPGGVIAIDEKLQGGETEAIVEFAKEMDLPVKRGGPNQVPMLIEIPG